MKPYIGQLKSWLGFNKNSSNPFDYSKAYSKLGIPMKLNYPSTTLGRMIDQTAKRFRNAPAITYNSKTLSYKELLDKVNRLAGGLRQIGVNKGQNVLLTLPNCPEFVVSFLAAQKLGASVVNAGPLMGSKDLKEIIKLTKPHVIIALDLHTSKFNDISLSSEDLKWVWVSIKSYQTIFKKVFYQLKVKKGSHNFPPTQHQITLSELIENSPSKPPTVASDPEDTAILQPTGGTTGILKIAELSHSNILSNAIQTSVWAKLRQGQERTLAILPMFHVYGLSTCLVASIFNAAHIFPLPKFDVDELINVIIKNNPTILPLVPVIINAISSKLEEDELLRKNLSSSIEKSFIISGAAALLPEDAERFEKLTGAKIIQGYGMTEASPVTHINPTMESKPGYIGFPLPDTEARIVSINDKNKEVGPNEEGELVVGGPQVMKGYYKNKDATEHMLQIEKSGKKWLFTGDVAIVDDDGYFKLVDRKKDMINKGGMKIWPGKVEAVLSKHPNIQDVAVYGDKDDKYGEIVVAAIVLNNNDSVINDELEEILVELCKGHLAKYEVPSRFEFVEKIPRNGLGKLLRYELTNKE